jgi:hypothetical protein
MRKHIITVDANRVVPAQSLRAGTEALRNVIEWPSKARKPTTPTIGFDSVIASFAGRCNDNRMPERAAPNSLDDMP